VRGVLVVTALLAGCSFDHGMSPTDAPPPDIRPDTVPITWEVDGTSKKGVPAAAFEWLDMLRAVDLQSVPPNHVWLMQESIGPLADSVGAVTLDPLNAPSYRNAVPGWSRAAVGTYDTVANQGFITTNTGNLNGPSYLLLLYVAVIGTPSSERSLAGIGSGNDHRYVSLTATPTFKGTGIGVTPTTGTVNPMTTVHPLVVSINPAKLSYIVYTDQEKLSVSWVGTGGAGPLLIVGNAIVGSAAARYLYGAMWTGPGAELDDSQVKKLLQGLGWTITGY
jgi:hypothetical protein